MTPGKVLNEYFHIVIAQLSEQGIDISQLLGDVDLEADVLEKNQWISYHHWERFLHQCALHTDNPAFGPPSISLLRLTDTIRGYIKSLNMNNMYLFRIFKHLA